jgi:hypothetical protein
LDKEDRAAKWWLAGNNAGVNGINVDLHAATIGRHRPEIKPMASR